MSRAVPGLAAFTVLALVACAAPKPAPVPAPAPATPTARAILLVQLTGLT